MDLFSRKLIGWALSEQIDAELTLAGLRMALGERGTVNGCIHHSDRGVQYACHAYVEELEAAGMRISMARKGNPYDNPAAESFMKTLKYKEVYLWDYQIARFTAMNAVASAFQLLLPVFFRCQQFFVRHRSIIIRAKLITAADPIINSVNILIVTTHLRNIEPAFHKSAGRSVYQ